MAFSIGTNLGPGPETALSLPFEQTPALTFRLESKGLRRDLREALMTLSGPCPILSPRKMSGFALITLALIVGYAQQTTAQSGMNCHPLDMREAVPPEKLPPPLKLTGIGNAHIHITATPEAQMWFDQGLNLLHDFWDYESVRAFEQSVRVDPQCAMCYWGIYWAAKTNYRTPNKYFRDQALAKAVSLKSHASKSERLYIEASAAA